MKRIFAMALVIALALMGAAFAEVSAITAEVIDRFTDTWVADGYTAEIWYDEDAGSFSCDMVIGDAFGEYRNGQYDALTDTLSFEDGIRFHSTYDEAAVDYTRDIISEGLTAAFAIEDDKLSCVDSEGLVTDVVFLRLNDAEEIDGQALAEGSTIYTKRDVEEAFIQVENKFDTWGY